jgi:hypothetical protein
VAVDKEQLEIATKLNAVIESMARNMSRVEKSYETQLTSVEKLAAAVQQVDSTEAVQHISNLNTALKDLSSKMKDVSTVSKQTLEDMAKKAEAAGTSATSLTGKLTETAQVAKSIGGGEQLDALNAGMKMARETATGFTGKLKGLAQWFEKKFPTSVAVGTAALSGFVQGIRNVTALTKGVGGFFSTFTDGLVNIAASIIAIPFKMFNALVDLAANAGGGMNELAQAIENLRKEFGALSGPTPHTVIEMSKTLKGFSDTGLSAFRVFGNLAERIEAFTKLAVGMGATFQRLTKEFQNNGGAILAYQKGLGISDEQMAAFGQRAIAQGEKISDVLKDTAKYALELGKAFGVDSKVISKDMAKAMADVKHFGGATTKSIAEAATYARKLGVELDKITGTLDAFETFDTAAENVAKLSQSFGVQVDAFKLMEQQDPASQVDMLRKSFLAAGKSADTMSRQELKLLAQTTGLDEATARMAFSAKNQALSLDEIKKKGGEAEKKTMTQTEAMSKLADSIERLVKSGGGQTGGFFDMFFKGFLGGVQSTKEFREIIWNIKRGLQQVYFEGVRLGRAFVEMFPGVKDFLQGIADFFKPEKFKRLAGGVTDVLKNWMKDLSDPHGKASFGDLMDKLKDKFFDFFNSESTSGKKMLEGFKTIMKTVSRVVSEGIKWIADKMTEGITFVTDLLTGKKKLDTGGAGAEGLGFLGQILMPLVDALKHAWKVLAPAVWELLKVLGKKLMDFLTSDEFLGFIKPAIPYIAAVLFGPALTRAILGALASSLAKGAVGFFTGGGGKKVIEEAGGAISKVTDASKKVSDKGAGSKGIDQVGAVNKAAGAAIDKGGAGDKWGARDAVKLGLKLVALAAALAVGGVMMAGAVVLMAKILDAGGIKSVKDVVAPLLILGAMVLAGIPLMLGMKLASKAGSMGDVLKGGLVISVAVAIVGVVAAGIAYLLKQVANPAQLEAAGSIMLKMSLVFLAMVPLIFASMVIGALASGPQAIALAAAAVGLGVIGVAVGEMAGIAMGIVKELSALKIDATFQRKIDAFLGIMRAIQAFADTLVKVIDLMTPSFSEIITGNAVSFPEKVAAATKLIREMVGAKGSGNGIIGIIETVMKAISDLSIGGPGMAEGAKIFSEILTGVSEFMKAAAPPDAFFEAGSSFLVQLGGGKPFTDLATDVGYYAKLMREGAMEMLTGSKDGKGQDGILGIIMKLTAIPIPDPKSAEVVANLLASTAQVMKTITPDPNTVKAFTTSVEQSAAWGLMKTKVEKVNTGAMTTVLQTMGDQLKEILPVLTSSVITSVTSIASNLSKDSLEKIKVLGDIFKIVVDLTNAIGNATKAAPVSVGNVSEGAIVRVTQSVPSLKSALDQVGSGIGPLMKSLQDVVSKVPLDKDFKAHLEVASKLFAFITELPKLAASISDASKASGGGGDINPEPMFKAVATIGVFLWKIANEKGYGTSRPVLTELIENMKGLQALGVDKVGPALTKTADTLKAMFTAISQLGGSMKLASGINATFGDNEALAVQAVLKRIADITTKLTAKDSPLVTINNNLTGAVLAQTKSAADNIKAYGDSIAKTADSIKSGAITSALDAVTKMVKSANDLDAALADGNVNKLNVAAKLGNVAKAAGLGGKASYSIQNRGVNITINMQVTMDVGQVEKAMVLRASSIVRDRLNFLTDEKKEQQLPQSPDGVVKFPLAGAPSTG